MSNINLIVTERDGTKKGMLTEASLDACEWELCKAGGAAVSINPLHPQAELVEENKTEIQIWIDEEYRHCVVPRSTSGNSKKVTFQCEGILSNFDYRHFNDSIDYGSAGSAGPPVVPPTYMEQFQIAQDMIDYAQTGPNRDLRIDTSMWTPSGIGRLRRYNWYDHTNILEELEKFAVVENGFEFDIVLFPDGRREFTFYFPRKGFLRGNVALVWGRNVVDFTYNKNGSDQGTKTYAVGASEGDVRFEANYEDEDLSEEYGQMERIVSVGQEKDVVELAERAREETAAFGRPVVLPDLIVRDLPASGSFPALKLDGVLQTGDTVPVNVQAGVCKMVGNYRITKIVRQKNGRLRLSFNEERAA